MSRKSYTHRRIQTKEVLVEEPETVCTCDWCEKQVVHKGEMRIGSPYDAGWFNIVRTPKSTALEELRRTHEWDFCSFECVSLWVNDTHTRFGL